MSFDLGIIETGNGGDLQLVGNDFAIVYGIENMPYLGMFGGNKEEVTKAKPSQLQSFDYWGNNLLAKSNPSIQFNSILEKTFKTTALTSSGRSIIENAIKKDLQFLSDLGATIVVTVIIVATDRINVGINITMDSGDVKVIEINFRKNSDGDFFIMDFNDDFFL